MTRAFTFHELAERELNEAAAYYDGERPGLGDAFLDEVERAITAILDNPEAAQRVTKNVRRKLVDRFPYAVLYSLRPDGIRVLAIMSQKRRPFYWRGRR